MLASLFRLIDPPPVPTPNVGEVMSTRIAVEPEPSRMTEPASRGRIVFHPRYEQFLRKCGIDSVLAALELPGEIVCGHPDRHVCRVVLQCGTARKVMYLKREHQVPIRAKLRNQRDGFGWVSRSEREAAMLNRLEETGLPGPQWLAYGDDETGRAFLLVDELVGAANVRTVMSDNGLSQADRRVLTHRAARAIATLHRAGFSTPELAAKHLFINPSTQSVTLVDWQSATVNAHIPDATRARQLAGLHASLAAELLDTRDRLRFVAVYIRTLRQGGVTTPNFKLFVRQIQAFTGKLTQRSSIRDQQQVVRSESEQRLVWLAGETVCAIPEVAAVWPSPPDGAPFYPSQSLETERTYAEEWVTFSDGRRALLTRFRSFDPVGRTIGTLREKPWRSPAAKAARILFHLARHNVAAPKLLAFGQKLTDTWGADSFLLQAPLDRPVPVAVRVAELVPDSGSRFALLQECGALLRRIHDAGLRLIAGETGRSVFQISHNNTTGVGLESPLAVEFSKQITSRARRTDLRMLLHCELASLSRSDRLRVVVGYLGQSSADRTSLRQFSTGVV